MAAPVEAVKILLTGDVPTGEALASLAKRVRGVVKKTGEYAALLATGALPPPEPRVKGAAQPAQSVAVYAATPAASTAAELAQADKTGLQRVGMLRVGWLALAGCDAAEAARRCDALRRQIAADKTPEATAADGLDVLVADCWPADAEAVVVPGSKGAPDAAALREAKRASGPAMADLLAAENVQPRYVVLSGGPACVGHSIRLAAE